ncbi:MAG: potassium channel family protein, partial [Muribaculaceae bacterium]|nr:potassium channel family protein [Muribaculaceae bacterium]
CIRYIPLIRGGYAMSIVVSWFTYNRATGLFISYLMTLLFTIYFSSLAFFLFEKGVNPGVKTYGDAVWWAFMDATTVGSNIVAVTTVGKVLSVLLAAIGMMMFPIFTVYVTNILTKHNQEGKNPILSMSPTDKSDSKNQSQNQASNSQTTSTTPQSAATPS